MLLCTNVGGAPAGTAGGARSVSDISHAVRPSGSATGTYPSAVDQPVPSDASPANATWYSPALRKVPTHGSGTEVDGDAPAGGPATAMTRRAPAASAPRRRLPIEPG